MKRVHIFNPWLIVLLMITILFLGSCSSDDDDTTSTTAPAAATTKTITGTAASGAPIVGYVKAKGANGVMASADIDVNGKFALDVTSLTAPYILVARGTVNNESVRLYSTGVAEGKINITPITNLITNRVVPGVDNAFENWSSASVVVNSVAIQMVEETVQNQLAPILESFGITETIDLMSGDFNTDHSGLDAVLDIVDIKIDSSNNVTITNTATGTSIIGNEAFSETEGTAMAQVISETAAMNLFFTRINTAFADELPTTSEMNTDIAPYVADDYVEDGRNKTQTLDRWQTGDGPPVGISFTISINRPMSASEYGSYEKGYWINICYSFNTVSGSFLSSMVYNGANWLWFGNQKWFSVQIQPIALKNVNPGGEITYMSGLRFEMEDNENYSYNQGIRSLIVTGPGLPASGLVFQSDYMDEKWKFYNVSPTYWDDIYLTTSDSAIGAIPENSVYTVRAYAEDHATVSLANTAVKTYTQTVTGRPHKSSELIDSIFPVISSHPTHSLSDLNIGSNITVTWNEPADTDTGWTPDWIWLGWGESGSSLSVENNDVAGKSSTVLDTTGNNISSITWASLEVNGYDVYGRQIVHGWSFQ